MFDLRLPRIFPQRLFPGHQIFTVEGLERPYARVDSGEASRAKARLRFAYATSAPVTSMAFALRRRLAILGDFCARVKLREGVTQTDGSGFNRFVPVVDYSTWVSYQNGSSRRSVLNPV